MKWNFQTLHDRNCPCVLIYCQFHWPRPIFKTTGESQREKICISSHLEMWVSWAVICLIFFSSESQFQSDKVLTFVCSTGFHQNPTARFLSELHRRSSTLSSAFHVTLCSMGFSPHPCPSPCPPVTLWSGKHWRLLPFCQVSAKAAQHVSLPLPGSHPTVPAE